MTLPGKVRWVLAGLLLAAAPVLAGPSTQPVTSAKAASTDSALPMPATRPALEDQPLRLPATEASSRSSAGGGQAANGLDLQRIGLALLIVLGLIYVVKQVGKRYFALPSAGGRSTRAISVLGRTMLAPKQQLMLVQVGKRLLVVANNGTQMNSLCEITDPDEVEALHRQVRSEREETSTIPFGSMFGWARGQFGQSEEEPETKEPAAVQKAVAELEEPFNPEMATSKEEIMGLMDKVRLMSKQFNQQ